MIYKCTQWSMEAESEVPEGNELWGDWKASWKRWVFRWRQKVAEQVYVHKAGGREFQILGPVTLKLWAPSEVRTNGTESRLVMYNLRERVEWCACKARV